MVPALVTTVCTGVALEVVVTAGWTGKELITVVGVTGLVVSVTVCVCGGVSNAAFAS